MEAAPKLTNYRPPVLRYDEVEDGQIKTYERRVVITEVDVKNLYATLAWTVDQSAMPAITGKFVIDAAPELVSVRPVVQTDKS